MSRVGVSGRMLRWAMTRGGASPASLEKKFPGLHEWEEGSKHPTLRQLEEFAQATRTPLGYLFLDQPPVEHLPIPHFRTISEGPPPEPSPDLLETVHLMQRRQEWFRDYLVDQGVEPIGFVDSAERGEDPVRVAGRLHEALGLEADWAAACGSWEEALRVFRTSLEGADVVVVGNGIVGNNTHRKLNPQEFRGFVLVDDVAPLVFLNTADAQAAQMFTLAHELAHLAFGSSAAFDLRRMQPADDPTERACNKVAAEFLVPENRMREAWRSARTQDEPFQVLARRFKVSVLVVARRALDLSLIGRQDFFDFYDSYLLDDRRRATKKEGQGDFYKNQNLRVGRSFASAVVRAVGEGRLLYSEAYRLTGLHGATFERYARSLSPGETR